MEVSKKNGNNHSYRSESTGLDRAAQEIDTDGVFLQLEGLRPSSCIDFQDHFVEDDILGGIT